MKKLAALVLGLGLVIGTTVSFAQDGGTDTTKKKKKKKKTEGDAPAPKQ